MTVSLNVLQREAIAEAVTQLGEATVAKKCWQCGCLHSTLRAIDEEMPAEARPTAISEVMAEARSKLLDVKYDCLGCEICWPANAVNVLGLEGEACPAEPVTVQEGWPPLPGSYTVLHYHAPVAICTLTDSTLAAALAQSNDAATAIIGTMFTENLGIERLIENILANPNIRFVIVCGEDSGQQIGHLAGQSLVALACNGVDEQMKIIGARGKRPRIKNLSSDAVQHFRNTVKVIDMVNNSDVNEIRKQVARCTNNNPGPPEPFTSQRLVNTITGYIPDRMVSDPIGYFVVYVNRSRGRILLEHYHNQGLLNMIIEGRNAAELYTPAVERGLLSRLDHAAYLGRELARAEMALATGDEYVQDAAPEAKTACSISDCCEPRGVKDTSAKQAAIVTLSSDSPKDCRRTWPRWILPVATFAFIVAAHYTWLGFYPEKISPGAVGNQGPACTDTACYKNEPCAPIVASSWFDRYVAGQDYWLGLSYGSSLAFAAIALRRYREKQFCTARNLAIGSITLSGFLAVLGCYLLGCCGSPMLTVYLNLFGAAFLPLAKPLVALLTVVSLGIAWWWMKFRE